MSGSIRLSEKHGVNPTLGVCFWCGEDDGTIGLLGKLRDDAEAARRTVLTYDPCPKCVEAWKAGVALIVVAESPQASGQPPIVVKPSLYPTGQLLVLTREATLRIFDAEAGPSAVAKGRAFIPLEVFEMLQPGGPDHG